MNISVVFFFLHNVLATLVLGSKFRAKEDKTLKNFGIALLLDAVAFAIWSVAIVLKVQNLETYVTIGVVFFIVSLIFFLMAGTQNMNSKNRQILVVLGIIIGAILLYLRSSIYPSAPGFSPAGFFFFNPHPVVQMLYIFGIMLAAIPAINAVSLKFTTPLYSKLVQYGFVAETAGAIVLITSSINNPDTVALYVTGWIIGLVYLMLWTTFAFNKKVWL